MTPDQATRAAFLIEARKDILYDLDPPQAHRDSKTKWKYGLTPLGMGEADDQFDLDMSSSEDDEKDGTHMIARLDRGLVRKAMEYLVAEIEGELRELGVDLSTG